MNQRTTRIPIAEADSCAAFAARLAESEAAWSQRAKVAEVTGRPDLAQQYRSAAERERLELLSDWLSTPEIGHPSLSAIRAAARAEGHSHYSSRGRRARRAQASLDAYQRRPHSSPELY
jgi:hypothetical protein